MLGKGNDDQAEETLGGRLRKARLNRGWGVRELARQSKLDPSSVSDIENGKIISPRAITIKKLAAAMGIDPQVIWGNERQQPRARRERGRVFIPVVQRRIYAGEADSWQETGETLDLGGEFAEANRDLLAGRVTGSCMSPFAEPGEMVVWDRAADRWVDGQMVVVTVETELLIKWAYRLPDGSVLLAAPDGTEIRPNGAILEGPVIKILRDPVRGPRRG